MTKLKLGHIDGPEALGRRMREARLRAGLSQEQVAFPGCSAAYVSLLESGKRVPSLQIVRELAARIGVSEEFLAWGADAPGRLQGLLQEGEIALALGELDRAGECFGAVAAGTADERLQATALEGLGRIAVLRGAPGEAIGLLEQALRVGGWEPSDRPRLAEALGRAWATTGELVPAIELFRSCADRFREEQDDVSFVRFSCLLGYALTDNGDFAQAEQVVADALSIGRGIGDPYTRARLYWSQSRLLLEQGKSDLAERYALRTIELLRATEDGYALAHAYQSLAHIYLDLGRGEEAERLLRQGRPLLETAATGIEKAHYQIDEARAAAACGRLEQAAGLAMRAAEGLDRSLPTDAGRAYLLLAQIFDDLGDAGRARELCELSIEILEQGAAGRYLAEAYARLASLLKADGDLERAYALLERSLEIQHRSGSLRLR